MTADAVRVVVVVAQTCLNIADAQRPADVEQLANARQTGVGVRSTFDDRLLDAEMGRLQKVVGMRQQAAVDAKRTGRVGGCLDVDRAIGYLRQHEVRRAGATHVGDDGGSRIQGRLPENLIAADVKRHNQS